MRITSEGKRQRATQGCRDEQGRFANAINATHRMNTRDAGRKLPACYQSQVQSVIQSLEEWNTFPRITGFMNRRNASTSHDLVLAHSRLFVTIHAKMNAGVPSVPLNSFFMLASAMTHLLQGI